MKHLIGRESRRPHSNISELVVWSSQDSFTYTQREVDIGFDAVRTKGCHCRWRRSGGANQNAIPRQYRAEWKDTRYSIRARGMHAALPCTWDHRGGLWVTTLAPQALFHYHSQHPGMLSC